VFCSFSEDAGFDLVEWARGRRVGVGVIFTRWERVDGMGCA
jgi:hypothetical protein